MVWILRPLLFCRNDPTEHVDLALTMPAKLEELKVRVKELRQTLFNPDRCAPFTPETSCAMAEMTKAIEDSGGFSAPYMA